jgi:hypothetical protein
MYNNQSGSSGSIGQEVSQNQKDISQLKAKAAHYVNDTFCDNFYVSSQEDEIIDEQRSCGAKSQSDGSEFNLSKLSTKHCVFGQEKISFAKKSRRSISMDYGKNSKFEKISSISFESVSSDQENFEIFQDYSEDIDFMETL